MEYVTNTTTAKIHSDIEIQQNEILEKLNEIESRLDKIEKGPLQTHIAVTSEDILADVKKILHA